MADILYGFDPSFVAQDAAGNVASGTALAVHTTYSGSNPFTSTKAVNPVTLLPGASTGGVVMSDSLGRIGFFADGYSGTLYLRQGSNSWPINPTLDADRPVPAGTTAAIAGKVGKGDLVFNVKDYGATGNGSTSDTAAIQAGINAAAAMGGTLLFPQGTYECSGLALKSNVRLLGHGGATLRKNVSTLGTNVITSTGTLGVGTDIAANVALGATTVVVTSAAALAVGDFVLLRDSTYKYLTYGRNQEVNRVRSITGTTVTLTASTIGLYTTAATGTLFKLNAVYDATVDGLTIINPAGVGGGGVSVTLSTNVNVTNCDISGFSDDPGISYTVSANSSASHNRVHDGVDQTLGGYAYAIAVGESSHGIVVANNHVDNVRECIFSNNARQSQFVNNVVRGVYASGVNTHGSGCENILIAGNTITGGNGYGVSVGHATDNAPDINITISNNVISNMATHGIATSSSSTSSRSKGVVISGNIINDVGLTASSCAGVFASNTECVIITGNAISCPKSTLAVNGITLSYAEHGAQVTNNVLRNLGNRGIRIVNISTEPPYVAGNRFYGVGSNRISVDVSVTCVPAAVLVGNLADGSGVAPLMIGNEVLIGNKLNGAMDFGVRTATVTTTASASDSTIIMNAAGATVLNLPTPVGITGRTYRLRNRGAGTATITPAAGTIDTAATLALAGGDKVTVQSDGANWWTV